MVPCKGYSFYKPILSFDSLQEEIVVKRQTIGQVVDKLAIDNVLVVSEEGGTKDNPILTVHPNFDETLLKDAAKISPKPKKTKLRESNDIDYEEIVNVEGLVLNIVT